MKNESIVTSRIEETYNQLTKAEAMLECLMREYIIGAWENEKFRTAESVGEEEVLFTILTDIIHDANEYARRTIDLAFEK